MAIKSIGYILIFGKPLIMYTGILTLISFLITALVGYLNYRGIRTIPFKYHPWLAAISITLALIHGLMGILAYF
ncbi:MAG: hypothetical protein HYW86_02520 [Candidatus Roizmanbacteria bacterium]|nr:MAG: hypothetical protein HYW86_02520 [Candidatus Roizmanbacteria bacterium]